MLLRSAWRARRGWFLAGLAGFVAAGLFAVIRGSASVPVERSVTLVAKDVKFNGTNPSITVKVGERVTMVLENHEQDPIPHNLQVTGFGVTMEKPVQPGRKATLTFSADRPGTYIYQCPLHPGSMDGRLIVEP